MFLKIGAANHQTWRAGGAYLSLNKKYIGPSMQVLLKGIVFELHQKQSLVARFYAKASRELLDTTVPEEQMASKTLAPRGAKEDRPPQQM